MRFMSPNSPLGRWLSFFLDAILICVAWVICSLPIVTLGASTAALNRVAFNWMRDRSGCDLRTYLKAFLDNFKTATAVWLMLLVPLVIILFNAYAVWVVQLETSALTNWLTILSGAIWVAVAIYGFALQAIFDNKPWRTLTNALRISVAYLFRSVLLVAMFAIAILATFLFPFGAVVYVPVCVFLSARPIWNVFVKVMTMAGETANQANEIGKGEEP